MIKQNAAVFILVFTVALVSTSCLSYISYRATTSRQKGKSIRPDSLNLGTCALHVHFFTDLDDKRTFHVILSFAKEKCNVKVSNLEVNLDTFSADEKQYGLKEIRLYKKGRRDLYWDVDTIKTISLVNLTLDTANTYELDYKYSFWSTEPPSKRLHIMLNVSYEIEGETQVLRDSIVFTRHKKLYFWR